MLNRFLRGYLLTLAKGDIRGYALPPVDPKVSTRRELNTRQETAS